MTRYSKNYQKKATPQSEAIPGSTQVENSAGGYSWELDNWKRLDRFLILGTEGGTYYINERNLTVENAKSVVKCLKEDGVKVVDRVVEISQQGRAPKNDPALYVLALAASDKNPETRRAALAALPKVARTGTHLFSFIEDVESLRGWGRGLRKAIGNWYLDKTPESVAYQVLKYRQRGGWSHRDTLRLSHPFCATKTVHNSIFKWITKETASEGLPTLIEDFIKIQGAKSKKEVISALKANKSLTWEMVPTEYLKEKDVWKALLPNMPMTAMIRNLGRMTANGLLTPMGNEVNAIIDMLNNEGRITEARIHPIAVLAALTTYAQGHGAKGKLSWDPVNQIIDALDKAFYLAFKNVEPTGKRLLLGLDVSSSMDGKEVSGVPGLTPRMAAGAMAMVTMKTESKYHTMAFSHTFVPLNISARMRLDTVVRTMRELPFGGTDCALPMVWAREKKVPVDTFIIYTDNETWAGGIHPAQALVEYRLKMGIPAKLIVVGMVGNRFTIADPDDAGMLDVVGFDTAVPNLMSDFIKE